MTTWLPIAISVLSLLVSGLTYYRTDRWQRQERAEAGPHINVLVQPPRTGADVTEDDSGGISVYELGETARVLVTVQDMATEPATVNHASIALRGEIYERAQTGAEHMFPARLEPRGGQLSFEIDAKTFDDWIARLGAERVRVGVHRETFTVYASMDP